MDIAGEGRANAETGTEIPEPLLGVLLRCCASLFLQGMWAYDKVMVKAWCLG